MVKNYVISVTSQEEKKGSVEFQVFNFTNKIQRLTSHLELHKKDYLDCMSAMLQKTNKDQTIIHLWRAKHAKNATFTLLSKSSQNILC